MLPLRHRLTHSPVLILNDDDAWNSERIDSEIESINANESEQWSNVDDHPYMRYVSGQSRYDLETVKEYLDMSKEPVQFVLQRLRLGPWAELQGLWRRDDLFKARQHAVRYGLADIVNMPTLELERYPNGGLTNECLESLHEQLGEAYFQILAQSIQAISIGLSELEKKA